MENKYGFNTAVWPCGSEIPALVMGDGRTRLQGGTTGDSGVVSLFYVDEALEIGTNLRVDPAEGFDGLEVGFQLVFHSVASVDALIDVLANVKANMELKAIEKEWTELLSKVKVELETKVNDNE